MKKLSFPHFRPLPLVWFAAILSLVNLVLYNIPFLTFIVEHAEGSGWQIAILIAMVAVVMFALHFMLFYLLLQLLRYAGRILIAILFFLSGACNYFIFVYHNLMDKSMMANVFNTRYSEASSFFTPTMWLAILLLGLVPALYILLRKTTPNTWKTFGYSCGGSLLVSLLLALVNLNQILWIGKYDTELGGLVMPWSYVVNTGLLIADHAHENKQEILLPDATITDQEKCAVVLVIGESARKANFQLYGYARETNPRLSQLDNLHVLNANSCATYTTAGVKSILEHKDTHDLYEILPNYLFRTGVDVAWRTSNWGEPPVHIDEYVERSTLARQAGIQGEAYDDILLSDIKQRILSSQQSKVLIIAHTSTSHGPDYQRQYPEAFAHFLPVCTSVENAEKERDRLMNAYDNTIVFTDSYLRDLIDSLRTLDDWHCAMLYVSDHGESLGENNLFMHGVPLTVAPKEQYEIPFLVWTSSHYRTLKPQTGTIDQHYVFHSVLNLLSISSPAYNPDFDLFAPAQ